MFIRTIGILESIYPRAHFDGYNYRSEPKSDVDTHDYLFPRLFELLEPFRQIELTDVRSILFIDTPLDNGSSTGIPLSGLDTSDFVVTRSKNFPVSVYHFSPNVLLITDLVNLAWPFGEKIQSLDPRTHKVPGLSVKDEFYKRGILVLYNCWTRNTGKHNVNHASYWHDINRAIIDWFMLNSTARVVTMGNQWKFSQNFPEDRYLACPDISDIATTSDNGDNELISTFPINPIRFLHFQ